MAQATGQAGEGGPAGRIERLIAPALDSMGYEVVRVHLTGGGGAVLQVMAERKDAVPMTVDDCTDISRAVSALLDVEDPIAGAYTLEVSSPGIDRPLVKERDFERFAGFEVRIETRNPIGGRKKFRGRLRGLAEGRVQIETGEGVSEVPYSEIHRAKLVLTDELLARTDPRANG
ncbi:MAG: ribosome maturation factor RimP [Alphaproteobacteria bacterium]